MIDYRRIEERLFKVKMDFRQALVVGIYWLWHSASRHWNGVWTFTGKVLK
ncbi:hypothetical protein [Zhongshania sp.]|jgi:hypothetical protein